MSRRVACFVAVLALAALSPVMRAVPAAQAACPYYSIDTLATYLAVANPSIGELPQSQPVWSAFAIRPVAGEDWDVQLFSAPAADPVCVSSPVAASGAFGSGVDFVIGDYSYNPAGTYLAKCTQYSGVSGAYVRWRESAQVLTVNGPFNSRFWGGVDVIETWNVQLQSGTTYTVNFSAGGSLDAKVLLFRNPGASTYWAGRGAAVLSSSGTTTYTAPSSGTYAVVVVNDNGGSGGVSLAIGTCSTPTVLATGTAVHTEQAFTYHQFTQSVAYWTAVGVRSATADYDVSGWGGTAGSWPTCLSDIKASSGGVGIVDFVIGDFNHNPTGTYYASNYDYTPNVGADIEWDSGTNQLFVNDTAVARMSDTSDVLEVWDVFLFAGQTYNFAFDPSGSNLHLLLFRNTGGGVYWAGRASAQFDVTGCQTYTAPTTGYYGVVVTNETGATSSYSLGVSQAPCPCATTLFPEAPVATPNPDGYYRFTQIPNFWAVVATRGATNADDWDLTVAGSATGNPAPTCLGPTLISSGLGAGLVDIGVIDFDTTPLGTYFARTHHYSGGGGGVMEWDWTHGELFHNGFPTFQSMGTSDLAHSWDAYMVSGQSYVIEYAPSDVTIKLLVFENPGGGTYAVTRAAAVLTTSGTITYTPTVTGYHGLVVVNDQAVAGSYSIRYGSCSATALVSGTAVTANGALNSYTFAQHANRWAAAGVRSTLADWDMRVSATSSSPFPNCVGASLASSSSGALNYVDFVTGDFFHDPAATYYVEAIQYASPPLVASPVEWSEGEGEVLVNDNRPILGPTDANDVLHSWNVYLQSGTTYTFDFGHTLTANLHLLLFRNPGGGVYWAPRSAAEFDAPPGGGPFTYVPPSTGEYGLVLVNDDGVEDYYYFTVKACFPPTALASGLTLVDNVTTSHSFAQATTAWTAVGVRSTSDWDISVNLNPSGGPPGICVSGPIVNSGTVDIVDFVIGDFNVGGNVLGTYYALPYRFSGDQPGTVEWDSGDDAIVVGGAPIHRTTNSSDVLEIWDVFLTGGQTYGVYFVRAGAAHTQVLLFRNPGGTYWEARGANVLESAASTNYTAPSTGWYGLVVVNDDGGAGAYDLGIYASALAVESNAPSATALRSVQPNPARAQMSIEYTLRERAPVHLELLDLAGRVVTEVENGTREAGVWRTAWNGRTGSGAKAPPGVYLLRLEVDGRAVGQRKVTVLE